MHQLCTDCAYARPGNEIERQAMKSLAPILTVVAAIVSVVLVAVTINPFSGDDEADFTCARCADRVGSRTTR